METTPTKKSPVQAIIGIAVFIFVLWFFFGGGLEKKASNDLQDIKNKVALEAESQYSIAKRNGNAMDAYVQAGMVKAAYLQANDEANYQKWTAIEAEESRNVGLTH